MAEKNKRDKAEGTKNGAVEEAEAVDVPATGEIEASLEEVLQKKSETESEEEEEELFLELDREDAPGALSVRTVPQKANEFVCSSCHLVKHNSQMADRKARLCRDCV